MRHYIAAAAYIFGIWAGRKLWDMVFACVLLGIMVASLHAQGYQLGIVADSVRAVYIKDWDANASDPYQPERAYCLTYRSEPRAYGTLYVVTGIRKANMVSADPYHSIYWPCAKNEASGHVHPPNTCSFVTGLCVLGGSDAWACEPSPTDVNTLLRYNEPFNNLQCSREAIIFYFRYGSWIAIPYGPL